MIDSRRGPVYSIETAPAGIRVMMITGDRVTARAIAAS